MTRRLDTNLPGSWLFRRLAAAVKKYKERQFYVRRIFILGAEDRNVFGPDTKHACREYMNRRPHNRRESFLVLWPRRD